MKNKYQEAFGDIVDNGVTLDYFNKKAILPQEDNPLFIIQELVDKETPMKPFLLVTHKKPKKRQYQCPRCGNACLVRYAPFERNENRYCYHCGQKIDWSDEE